MHRPTSISVNQDFKTYISIWNKCVFACRDKLEKLTLWPLALAQDFPRFCDLLCSKSYISSNTIFNCSFTPKRLHRERSNHLFYKNFNFIHKSIQTCKFSICQYLISAREEFQNMRDPAMNFTEYTYSPSMKAI